MGDLAVAVALGGDTACDAKVLRAQPGVFGSVALDLTGVTADRDPAQDADGALATINSMRGRWPGNGCGALLVRRPRTVKIVIDLWTRRPTASARIYVCPFRQGIMVIVSTNS